MTEGVGNGIMFTLGAAFSVAPIFVAVVVGIAIFLVVLMYYVVHSGPNRAGRHLGEKERPIDDASQRTSFCRNELGNRGGNGHTRPTSSRQ